MISELSGIHCDVVVKNTSWRRRENHQVERKAVLVAREPFSAQNAVA